MRTRIYILDQTTVSIDYPCDEFSYYEKSSENSATLQFHIPTNGGFVRDCQGNQVTKGLNNRGHTLTANNVTQLLNVVRNEWSKSYIRK